MQAYVINLPDARERRAHMRQCLERSGIDYRFVDGVVGRELTLPHPDYNERAYRLAHGKRTNLSELGCYFSHIKVLRMFLETDEEHALILEDDVSLPENLGLVLAEALQHAHRFDLLRLSGLHRGTPVRVRRLQCGHDLSCNFTTQTGSGAYLVNRKCARQMLEHLLPMWLPYDHALDRDWAYGVRAMCLDPMPVSQHSAFGSQIDANRSFKLPALQRYWTVLPYRSWNEILRVLHRTREIVRQRQDTSSGPRA